MVSIWIWSGKGGDERGVGDRLDQGASETRAGGRELLGLLVQRVRQSLWQLHRAFGYLFRMYMFYFFE